MSRIKALAAGFAVASLDLPGWCVRPPALPASGAIPWKAHCA
jgi:hypothetical protein